MIDMTNTSAPAPEWSDIIQHGDVVLFHFPCAEDGATETPKSRTCLVLEVETRDGSHFVKLAYGATVAQPMPFGGIRYGVFLSHSVSPIRAQTDRC